MIKDTVDKYLTEANNVEAKLQGNDVVITSVDSKATRATSALKVGAKMSKGFFDNMMDRYNLTTNLD